MVWCQFLLDLRVQDHPLIEVDHLMGTDPVEGIVIKPLRRLHRVALTRTARVVVVAAALVDIMIQETISICDNKKCDI